MVNFFIVKLPDRPYGKPDTRWWKSGPPVPAERRLDVKISKRRMLCVCAYDMDGRNTKSMDAFLCNNCLTKTCIFLMWFAWQTPWKTSGMQTGGTKCLSATLEYLVVVNFNALPPVSQTYSVNMRRQTGTVRPRCVRWFEGLALVFLLARLLSHPRSAWVASSLNDHTSKELPT